MWGRVFVFIGALSISDFVHAENAKPYRIRCDQKELESLSLDPQLQPTKNQQGGTCYAHQAAQVFRAALFRSGKLESSQCRLSPESCAFESCLIPENLNVLSTQVNLAFTFNSIPQYSLMDGLGIADVVPFYERFIEKASMALDNPQLEKELLTCYRKSVILGGQLTKLKEKQSHYYDLQKNLITSVSRSAQEKLHIENQIQRLQNEIKEINQSIFRDPCAAIVEGKKISKESKRVEFSKDDLKIKKFIQNWDLRLCQSSSSYQKSLIEELNSALCLGIPLAAGLNIKHSANDPKKDPVLMSKRSLEEQNAWTPVELNSQTTYHAVVLKGMTQEKDGAYFLFQNSWGQGSELRLHVKDVCQIASALGVLTAREHERWELGWGRSQWIREVQANPKLVQTRETKFLSPNSGVHRE